MRVPRCIRNALLTPVALLLISCGDGSGPPVHFIVPDGFRGRIDIFLDTKQGAPVELKEGRYTLIIPASGVLRVQSFLPFDRWHTATAVYASGTTLPVYAGTAGTNSTFGFYELGSSASSGNHGAGSMKSTVFFVGAATAARSLGF